MSERERVKVKKHVESAKVKKHAFLTHLQIGLKFGITIHEGQWSVTEAGTLCEREVFA